MGRQAQLFPSLCNPMDSNPPGSSVHGIFKARILEQVAISYSKGSSQPRDQTRISGVSCLGRCILYHRATWASESESHSVVSDSLWPHVHLQARILEVAAFPFSRGSFQPRDRTQLSHSASGFFTSRATREAQEYWSGSPIPSPVNLPDLGIEPRSPALYADSLPTELSRKPVQPGEPQEKGY